MNNCLTKVRAPLPALMEYIAIPDPSIGSYKNLAVDSMARVSGKYSAGKGKGEPESSFKVPVLPAIANPEIEAPKTSLVYKKRPYRSVKSIGWRPGDSG